MPGQSFALNLIQASTFPITATSANISGYKSADNIDDVLKYLK